MVEAIEISDAIREMFQRFGDLRPISGDRRMSPETNDV